MCFSLLKIGLVGRPLCVCVVHYNLGSACDLTRLVLQIHGSGTDPEVVLCREFPTFKTHNDIKVPGLSIANLECPACKVLITGKWFNYSLMFFVLLIDVMMLKNNIFYDPADCGQYVDPDNYVWTMSDPQEDSDGKPIVYTWEERQGCCGDFKVAAKFTDEPLAHKVFVIMPCLIVFVVMCWMIRRSVKAKKARQDMGSVAPRPNQKPYEVPGRRVVAQRERSESDIDRLATGDSLAEESDPTNFTIVTSSCDSPGPTKHDEDEAPPKDEKIQESHVVV